MDKDLGIWKSKYPTKKCPSCKQDKVGVRAKGHLFVAQCCNCGVRGPLKESEQVAVESFNEMAT
jgi:transcription elongation factor Elf1